MHVNSTDHHSSAVIRTGRLVVDCDARTASVDGRAVRLTRKEYAILELLSAQKGTPVTKDMFLDHLYGGREEPEIKIIDVFVCHLRKKLAQETGGEHYIETVWGRGYALRDPAPAAAMLASVSEIRAGRPDPALPLPRPQA